MDEDSSICESKSSDYEFWNAFDLGKKSDSPKEHAHKQDFKLPSLRISEKERYEKTINNIRDSKSEEIENIKIKTRNKTTKELFSSITEMKKKFQSDSLRLHESFADSRNIIQKKDFEILQLVGKAAEQESLISGMRILYNRAKKQKQVVPDLQEDDFKEQCEVFKLQVQTLKMVCEEFKREADTYKELNKNLIEENNELKKLYNDKADELANFSTEYSETLLKEKEGIANEYSRYRLQVEKELEVRELINGRHLQLITSLQEELKSAKLIINTPRIHYKAIERLKDTVINEKSERNMKTYRRSNKTPENFIERVKAKIPLNYSYKEYKVFNNDHSRQGLTTLRAVSITPRIDSLTQNNSKLSNSIDKGKLSRNSILYYNATQE